MSIPQKIKKDKWKIILSVSVSCISSIFCTLFAPKVIGAEIIAAACDVLCVNLIIHSLATLIAHAYSKSGCVNCVRAQGAIL